MSILFAEFFYFLHTLQVERRPGSFTPRSRPASGPPGSFAPDCIFPW